MRLTREQVRARLTLPSPFFLDQGFSAAVLDRHDVGDSPRKGKAIVPLHSDDGETIIGYLERSHLPYCETCRRCHLPGRACGYGQTQWLVMKGFPKRDHLYNYHTALRSSSQEVLLVKGPDDVWRAEEEGHLAVALLGSYLTDEQLQKLVALRKEVFIALPNDKALPHVLEKLSNAIAVQHHPLMRVAPDRRVADLVAFARQGPFTVACSSGVVSLASSAMTRR